MSSMLTEIPTRQTDLLPRIPSQTRGRLGVPDLSLTPEMMKKHSPLGKNPQLGAGRNDDAAKAANR